MHLDAHLIYSSIPRSRCPYFPFLDEDIDMERFHYFSKLTCLVSGRVWIGTHTVRWQSPSSSPPHQCQRMCKRNGKSISELTGRVCHIGLRNVADVDWRCVSKDRWRGVEVGSRPFQPLNGMTRKEWECSEKSKQPVLLK